jgi:hypothetical protein
MDVTPPAESESPADVTPAVYTTTLAFIGLAPPSGRAYLMLVNRADAATLDIDYRGWLDAGSGWSPVLDAQASTPVPRAAWRVLPVGLLRVKVTEGEELTSLIVDQPGAPVELVIGDALAEWSSATGQRESLKRASLVTGGERLDGVLLYSQMARPAGSASRGTEHAVLVSDSLGNGLVILRSTAEPASPVVVFTLFDGASRRWDGAELLPRPAGDEGAADSGAAGEGADAGPTDVVGGRWTLVVPGADIEGEIEVVALGEENGGGGAVPGLGAAIVVVTAADGMTRSLSGFQAALLSR